MSDPLEGGPYLTAAVACERVIEEKDGVKSLIRIVDRVVRTAAGPDPPATMAPFQFQLAIFISLKAGPNIRGSRQIGIQLVKPSTERSPRVTQGVYFEGDDDRGADLVVNTNLEFEYPGVYWFEITFEDRFLTRIPFRVVYLTQKIRPG